VLTYMFDIPYMRVYERGILYDAPTIHVDWNIAEGEEVNLSSKDTHSPLLAEAELNFKY